MAVITGLENLPIDAVECIANNLTTSELSNCCAVSHEWRKIFDNNIFWKKRFNKNITDYLKGAKCQVEPSFSLVSGDSANIQSVSSYREDCMRETHLWNNWSTGRFKLEEIKFDCDDSISYNIKVEFLTNDHVLLHRTFQTEVWDVSQKPILVLEIPFSLNEMWEENTYKVVGNRLVVVQCNVVQVFSICLESKTSNLDHVFFFDKSEEFSSSKLSDVRKIDDVFQETSYDIAEEIECVICGTFLLGIITSDMKNLVIHVWDINTGKKLKEEVCPVLPSVPCDVILKAGEKSHDKVIVVFDFPSNHCANVFLFDLEKLNFVEHSKIHHRLCDFTLFDKYLCGLSFFELSLIDYDLTGKSLTENNEPTILEIFKFQNAGSLRIFKKNLLLLNNKKEVLCIDPESQSKEDIKPLMKVDFNCSIFEVVQDKFLAFHDMECSLKEIWQVGESSKKIISFPEDSGLYRAVNSACTRLVLERANKLIILNFW